MKEVIRAKIDNPAITVLHRVDGPFSLVRGRVDYADYALIDLNRLVADGTVFQSDWSKKECLKLGLSDSGFNCTISNAPQDGIFYNNSRMRGAREKVRLIATSWSSNLNKGFDTYLWMDQNLDWSKYQMTFIGNSPYSFENIDTRAPQASADLATELRRHDIFISASRNDPCSNSVLEALHSGLPVVGYDGGGTPELIGGGGRLFTSPDEIPEALRQIGAQYEAYRSKIKVTSISEIGQRYIDFALEVRTSVRPRRPSQMQKAVFNAKNLSLASRLWAQRYTRLRTALRNRVRPSRYN